MNISIDIETKSSEDLSEVGVYKYAESEDFEILLFAYSINGGDVNVVDVANGELIPVEVVNALTDSKVTKWAFNANFERVCLSKYLGVDGYLNPRQWRCSMVWSAYLGLPHSLEGAGEALGVDKQKLSVGKNLIKKFSINGDEPSGDDWELFKEYNKRDVETELEIQNALQRYPMPESIWEEYVIDQQINDNGVLVDTSLVERALMLDDIARNIAKAKLEELTGLDNPNSVMQLKDWMEKNGYHMDSVGKQAVESALNDPDTPNVVREVLTARQQISRSSTKKYEKMLKAKCSDDRVRGMFKFYGAHTGRFTSQMVQLQNLPRNHIRDLDDARELVKRGDWCDVSATYDNVPDLLSQLIRTSFIAPEGKKLIVADFSAIEARVVAWLADERWVLRAFAQGKDIYCETASRMFKVPVEKNGKNADLRQKGKQACLACSYSGSIGALEAMGAIEMGIPRNELRGIVNMWRKANPKIVELWSDLAHCANKAVECGTHVNMRLLQFSSTPDYLFITLPSERRLAYRRPRLEVGKYGSEVVMYTDSNNTKRELSIASLTENIVQAIARDILMDAMKNLDGLKIVAHIHDEVVIEADESVTLDEIVYNMTITPNWAPGLLLNAEGFESQYYKKD